MGFVIVVALGLYLLISMGAVAWAVSYAKRHGKSAKRWGWGAALGMYLLVFWDWIPTVVAHKYYCATEAGFWVYKTPEQWKKENPDLTTNELRTFGEKRNMGGVVWSFPFLPFDNNPKRYATMINKRIYLDGVYEENILGIIPISKHVSFIADSKNGEKLAQQVTFGSGYGNPMTTGGLLSLKGWLANSNCSGMNAGYEEARTGFRKFINQVVKLGEKND
ncbi:MAG: hypothetical protein WA123_02295 [Methylotenera sp.]